MKITCWGTRGSISVGDADVARYGGDTISVEIVSNAGDLVILDAGTGIRKLGKSLERELVIDRDINILFSHYHLDHITGMPFFAPIFNSKANINVYGPVLENVSSVADVFSTIIGSPYFPLSLESGDAIKANIKFQDIGEEVLQIGSLKISTIQINHTNHGGLGFKIEENGKIFIFLTDNELGMIHPYGHKFEDYVEFCRDADLLFHDAQFTEAEYEQYKGWGHSTIEDVTALAKAANIKKCGFIHYAPNRTDEEVSKLYPFNSQLFPIIQEDSFYI
jgi:ribonuclease BN (tRNA processing enzyme)